VSSGDVITVNYVGWKWGSTEAFDSSFKKGAPVTFGLTGVIPGWTCGLAGHKVGERVQLSIPGKLAYGETADPARPNSPTGPLVFVVDITARITGDELTPATKDATVDSAAVKKLSDRGVTVSGDLGAPVASLQWVVDAYALTFAALQLSAGAACDRLGARSVHLLGLVVFGLLSAACALAPAGGALIAFRALQGVGAAAIVPSSLAILSLIHDRPAARARAIGLWGGAGGVAAAVGPVSGGLLVTFTGWRIVFWGNLPLVAAALWLPARPPPTSAPEPTSPSETS